MAESAERWKDALRLGVRAGLVSADAAARAIQRVDAAGSSPLAVAQVAEWAGIPPAALESLIEKLDARSTATEAPSLGALADSLLRGGEPDADATTLRIEPGRPVSDEPTLALPEARTTPSTVPPRAARPNIPTQLGAFELLEELGHGGMGIVFRARHGKLGTPCAVKVMIAGEHASPEEIARFQLEAQAVARMGKHPNIVTVFDLGAHGSLAYYAMELVEGKALSKVLLEGEMEPHEAARIAEKVARAIHFAHEKGILHRDLKPDNIVMAGPAPSQPVASEGGKSGAGGEPQVMDFGLARDVTSTDRRSVHGQVMGSPSYMAPEQARGDVEAIDRRTDVYGLGAILYEALCGFPPHPGRSWPEIALHILRGEVISPRKVRPGTPRDIETVCLKCLEREQGRRYTTAEELADDLARFQRGEPVRARPVGRVNHLVRSVRRHPLVSGLIAGAAALALALLWRFLGPATIRIETEPANARVEAIGATLWRGRLVWPPRAFRLRVSAEGYESQEVQVPATAGQTTNLGKVTLTERPGTLRLDGCPAGLKVRVVNKATGRDVTVLSPPVEVTLGTGEYRLEGTLKDHFARACDVTITNKGKTFANVSLNRQVLWTYETDGALRSSPALGDLNGDGCLDCVVGSNDNRVYALSSKDSSVLWTYETGGWVTSSPALGDLNGDGCVDCLVGSGDKKVYALSGRDGAVLWTYETGGSVHSSPALGDLNGDGCLDCVTASMDKKVYARLGRDGAVHWTYETGGAVQSSPALGDLNGDGCLDCVVGSDDYKVYALSGNDGAVLWTYETGGMVTSSPALGDLNADGCLDCVVGSRNTLVYALSGRDGAVLWTHETGGPLWSSPALGDLNGDGCLDCVLGSRDKNVYALSGRDGAVLWTHETGDLVDSSPALGDLDGDGCLDCVVGSGDKKVYALSGRDGAVLWTYETGNSVYSSPALGDLNGDGWLDCVVGSNDGSVYVLPGHDPKRLRASSRRRLGLYRQGRWWTTLTVLATERLAKETDPWARAVTLAHLGLARLRLGDPKAALDAFAEARRPASGRPRLRAPDGAAFEWLASWRCADCPDRRRAEARAVLLDALGFQPETVFDAFVEVRDLLTPEALADLRLLLDTLSTDNRDSQLVRAMLLAAFAREGVYPDLFIAAERRVHAKLHAAEGSVARSLGYLALLADAQGDRNRFRRLHTDYLDLPRRPDSLDALLAELAAAK